MKRKRCISKRMLYKILWETDITELLALVSTITCFIEQVYDIKAEKTIEELKDDVREFRSGEWKHE